MKSDPLAHQLTREGIIREADACWFWTASDGCQVSVVKPLGVLPWQLSVAGFSPACCELPYIYEDRILRVIEDMQIFGWATAKPNKRLPD